MQESRINETDYLLQNESSIPHIRAKRLPLVPALFTLIAGIVSSKEILEYPLLLILLVTIPILFFLFIRDKRTLTITALLAVFAVGAVTGNSVTDMKKDFQEEKAPIAVYIEEVLPWSATKFSEAVLLSDRSAIEPHDKIEFRRCGITHLLAISGLHVGLVAGLIYLIAGIVFKRSNLTCLATITSILVYIFGIGAPASAVRAGIMISIFISSGMLGRLSNPLNVLAGAAFLNLLFEPSALFNVSFQLSYAAAFGLIAWTKPLSSILPKRPKYIFQLFAASVSAQVLTIPIMMWHFREFAPIAFIANIFAVPIFGLLLYSIIGAMMGIPFMSAIALWLLEILRLVAKTFSALPGSTLLVNRPSLFLMVSIAGIALATLINSRAKRIAIALILGIAGLAAVFTEAPQSGVFLIADKYNHCGAVISHGESAVLMDDGVPLVLWKDAITRIGVPRIEKVIVNSKRGLSDFGVRGLEDYCYIREWNLPEKWEKNSEVKEVVNEINLSGGRVNFRSERYATENYRGRLILLGDAPDSIAGLRIDRYKNYWSFSKK